MKNILLLTAAGAALLSGCSVFGTRAAAVSGQLRGFNPEQNLRLALVGYNGGKYVADGRQAQLVDKALTGGFTFTLPRDVPSGIYRLVVFRDVNNNNSYDAGDTIVSKYNGKALVYAPRDNYIYTGTKYGWNIYTDDTKEVQTLVLNNYDIASAN